MKIILAVFALGIASSSPAQAQSSKAANPAVSSARALWQQLTGYITTAAEQMPDSDYAFRPTPKVRTFGQLIGHIAGSQHMICGSALGEKPSAEDAIENKITGKAELIAALKASTAHCEKAYAQSDAMSRKMTSIFGEAQPRIYSLMINATHNGEHYGNIVTYIRVLGRVPPSSQPPTGR